MREMREPLDNTGRLRIASEQKQEQQDDRVN